MEEIPVYYYYKLLGVKGIENTLIEFELKEYFETYKKFEDTLFRDFRSENCGAHFGIPYFIINPRSTELDTKINAIIYAVKYII